MDRWLFLIVIVCFLFVLTYDPKSGNLEKYTSSFRRKENYEEPCCNKVEYMADNFRQCGPKHFQGVQFGDTDYGCPRKVPVTELGAILSK